MICTMFGEGTYTTQVCGISQRDAGQTMLLRPLDTNIHGLNSHDAAKARARIDAHDRIVVLDDLRMTMRVHMLIHHGFDIRWDHADTMRIVALEVSLDKMVGNCVSMG
mgnify:CR=1 FL=1